VAETGMGDDWALVEAKTREALRLRQRSFSTEKTYLIWLRSFRKFLDNKKPAKIGSSDIQRFLSYLAVERRISASTQNQALNALVFVYRHALDKTLAPNELKAVRAVYRRRLPVVLSVKEVNEVFDNLSGIHLLMAKLIYGCGFRLQECLSLRVKDVDLEQSMVTIR
jgi:integrase